VLAVAPCATAQQAAKVTVSQRAQGRDGCGDDPADRSAQTRALFANSPCVGPTAASPAKTGSVDLVFTDVKPGPYGLALFHDEDGDGRINVFNDAVASGNGASDLPPVFDNASLKVTGDLKTETALFKMVQ
jgi:uncharacterized protein (DUF2141 family)